MIDYLNFYLGGRREKNGARVLIEEEAVVNHVNKKSGVVVFGHSVIT